MNVHKNARTTMHSRAELVRRVRAGQAPRAVATALGIDLKTVKKWVARFAAEGPAGLVDRSSRPHHLNSPTSGEVCACIVELRRQRWTGKQIAKETEVSAATVSRVLARAGLARMRTWRRPSRWSAMSTESPAASSTRTSRSSGASRSAFGEHRRGGLV
jgi:transposase